MSPVTEQKLLVNATAGILGMSTAAVTEVLGWGAVVIVVSMFGWAVASLEQLAGWTDDAPKLAKLTIIKGLFASIAAAAIVVMIGHWQEWHPLLNVACAFLGGMAGNRLLLPLTDTLIGRLAVALDALLGKGGSPGADRTDRGGRP